MSCNCNDCDNESALPIGPAGTDGVDGTNGTNGTDGTDGADGSNGTSILYAYNSTTGAGVPNSLTKTLLQSYTLPANTWLTVGDEVELLMYVDYAITGAANIIFELGGVSIYTFNQSGASDEKMFFRVKMAMLSTTSQYWTIEKVGYNTAGAVTFIDTKTSAATTTASNLFAVYGQNVTTSTNNRVNTKKFVLYKYNV